MLIRLDTQTAFDYHTMYTNADNADRQQFVTDTIGNRQFYFNDQWTTEEEQRMSARGQYALKLNRIKKSITAIVGIINAEKPMFKSMPYGETDNITSMICNMVFSHVYSNSMGTVLTNRILKGALRDNIGYAIVKVDEEGKIVFDYIPAEYVIVDQASTDPFFRDAKVIYIKKRMRVSDVRKLYNIPEDENIATSAPDEWQSLVGDSGDSLRVTQLFDESKHYCDIIEGYHRELDYVRTDDQYGVRTRVRIIKRTLIGYEHIFEEELPKTITSHCIVPLYFDDTETVFKRGMVYFLKDIQKFLNKAFGTMLLNAQLHSNPKVFVYKDSVPNNRLSDFELKYNYPGAIMFLEGDGEDVAPPTVVQGSPLSAAWYQLVEMMMKELEFNTVNHQLIGTDLNQGKGQSHTQLFQSFELMLNAFREFLNLYEGFMSVLGNSLLQYFFTFASKEEIDNVFKMKHKRVAAQKMKKRGFDPDDPDSVQSLMKELMDNGMSPGKAEEMLIKGKKEVDFVQKIDDIIEDGKPLKFDIVVEKGSYLSSYSALKFAMKMELWQGQLVDNETVLEDAPLENRDEIINRVSQIKVQARQIHEQEQEIEKLKKEIDGMRQSVFQGQIKLQETEHQSKFDKQRNDFVQKERANQKIAKSNANSKLSKQLVEGEEAINQALLELKIKQAQYDIAKQKLEQNEDSEEEDVVTRIMQES